MGQKIFYVLTIQNVTMPIEIVHFKEGNATVIPLLIESELFESIANHAEEDDIVTKEDFFNSNFLPGCLEYPTKDVFSFVRNNLDSFAMIGYVEELGMAKNIGKPFFFTNRCKVDTSNLSEIDIHETFNSSVTFTDIIRNKTRYQDYYTAEKNYFKELQEAYFTKNK